MPSKYEARGVSAKKEDVHNAIKNLDKGIFQNSFAKILPDIVGKDEEYCNIMHADGAGTKSSLAYAYWKTTGDMSVWHGIAQDAIVMNTDDLLCVGVTDNMILSSTIGRNKHLIPGEVISAIIEGTNKFIDEMKQYDINITLAGGETADVGDLVRTIIVDSTVFARVKRENIISNEKIKPGNVIVGLSSFGKATYEKEYNSGIGSNGLTSARHDIFSKEIAKKYPETYDNNTKEEFVYTGNYKLTDTITINGEEITMGKLVLSPTRTYLPVMKDIFETYRSKINGIIHCSGGAQTKIMNFTNYTVIKDNLFDIPPLFQIIKEQSGTEWKEMYQVFNMGHRLEIITDEDTAPKLIDIARKYDVEAQVIGKIIDGDKKLIIQSKFGEFIYLYN
jgi:phosphoribosylformylglycinamidine cyclo-ligase